MTPSCWIDEVHGYFRLVLQLLQQAEMRRLADHNLHRLCRELAHVLCRAIIFEVRGPFHHLVEMGMQVDKKLRRV